ncbi:MAG: hypothetical protein EXS16_21810 [Gemmataceae bacterium]|nr:hypothetical protein [Gemmataceae bacterium]
MSSTFTYRRGAYSVSLSVTIGAVKVTPMTVLAGVMSDRDMAQPSPQHTDHPFWFNAADLVLNSALTVPADGDTIEQSVSGVVTTYKLGAPLDGGRDWRYADGHETGAAARICWNGRLKSRA